MTFQKFLDVEGACPSAVRWVGDRTFTEVYSSITDESVKANITVNGFIDWFLSQADVPSLCSCGPSFDDPNCVFREIPGRIARMKQLAPPLPELLRRLNIDE